MTKEEALRILNNVANEILYGNEKHRSFYYHYARIDDKNNKYFYTGSKVNSDKGELKFGSGVFKWVKGKKTWFATKIKYHSHRKSAEKRAIRLYDNYCKKHGVKNA